MGKASEWGVPGWLELSGRLRPTDRQQEEGAEGGKEGGRQKPNH